MPAIQAASTAPQTSKAPPPMTPEAPQTPSSAKTNGAAAVDHDPGLAQATLQTLQDQAEALKQWSRLRAETAKLQALETIERKPIGALATLFGVGLAVGLAMGLRRPADCDRAA